MSNKKPAAFLQLKQNYVGNPKQYYQKSSPQRYNSEDDEYHTNHRNEEDDEQQYDHEQASRDEEQEEFEHYEQEVSRNNQDHEDEEEYDDHEDQEDRDNEDEDDHHYQYEEEPIMEEENESDPESARDHRKIHKQSPKYKQYQHQNSNQGREQKKTVEFDDAIDIKKIKNSKLYQKFLKQNEAKDEKSKAQVTKSVDLKSTNQNKQGGQKEPQYSQSQSKKDISQSTTRPGDHDDNDDDDDVPYYVKQQQKQMQHKNAYSQDVPQQVKQNKWMDNEDNHSPYHNQSNMSNMHPLQKSLSHDHSQGRLNQSLQMQQPPLIFSNPELDQGELISTSYGLQHQNSLQAMPVLQQQGSFEQSGRWESHLEHGESTLNLNLQASSNYIAVPPQQNFINSFQGFQGFPGMMNPQYMQWMMANMQNGQNGGNTPVGKSQDYSGMNDAFLLNAKLQEVTQNLQREMEANRMLEAKCQEYMNQLERSAANFEEFKKKMFEQNSQHQQEVSALQEKIQRLNDQLQYKERADGDQSEEISALRRKLTAEQSAKNRLAADYEDLQRRYDELSRLKKDRDGYIDQKDEEIQRLKKQSANDRDEINYLKSIEEKLTQNIKELNAANTDLVSRNAELMKIHDEKDQRMNLIAIENESLRNQLAITGNQYRDVLNENENLKRELFMLKERSMETENELRTARMSNDKLMIEVKQLKDALARLEDTLDKERRHKAKLIAEASTMSDSRSYDRDRDYYQNREPEPTNRPQYTDRYQRENSGDNYQKYDNLRANNNPNQNYQQNQSNRQQNLTYESKYERNDNIPPKEERKNVSKWDDRPLPTLAKQQQQQEAEKKKDPAAIKYEEQFQKLQTNRNIHQSNIVLADPEPVTDRPRTKRGEWNNNNAVQENKNEVTPQKSQKTQHQIFKSTTGLLTWEEPPETRPKPRDMKENMDNTPVKKSTELQRQGPQKDKQDAKLPENVTRQNPNKEEHKAKADQIKNLENNLMNLQIQRDNLSNELQKLEMNKVKTAAIMKKKQELETDLNYVNLNISNLKNKLRELNVLHPY